MLCSCFYSTVGTSILDTFLRGFIKNCIFFQPKVKYKFPLSNLLRRAVAKFLTEGILIRNVKLKVYQLFVQSEKEPHDRYMVKVYFSCLNIQKLVV